MKLTGKSGIRLEANREVRYKTGKLGGKSGIRLESWEGTQGSQV